MNAKFKESFLEYGAKAIYGIVGGVLGCLIVDNGGKAVKAVAKKIKNRKKNKKTTNNKKTSSTKKTSNRRKRAA